MRIFGTISVICEVAQFLKNIPKSKIEKVAVFVFIFMIGDHDSDDDEARNTFVR